MSEEETITYVQYLNRLIEWSVSYLDYVMARVEFDDLVSQDFTHEEAFRILTNLRTEEWPQKQ